MKERISLCECKRCGHKWFPRKIGTPKTCPKCSSAFWNQDRAADWVNPRNSRHIQKINFKKGKGNAK